MVSFNFMEALEDLKRERGIEKEDLYAAIEVALASAFKKDFKNEELIVKIDRGTGEIKIYAKRQVVDTASEPGTIALSEAQKIVPDVKVGENVYIELKPRKDIGRVAAQTAKQVILQKLHEIERDMLYQEFMSQESEIVIGTVKKSDAKMTIVQIGKAETVLYKKDIIPGERFKPGDKIKLFITEVRKTSKGPQISVSRANAGFLRKLFELEIPEINDGIIEIKGVAREAGYRSKIGVYSKDSNIDPVGACVGLKGSRIHAILNELHMEKIDVVRWSPDIKQYITSALSPAKVTSITMRQGKKEARVIVPDDQLSLAIGKEGQNVRLAAKLTGYKIDIRSESQIKDKRDCQELLNSDKALLGER